jgi:hypothetical protein
MSGKQNGNNRHNGNGNGAQTRELPFYSIDGSRVSGAISPGSSVYVNKDPNLGAPALPRGTALVAGFTGGNTGVRYFNANLITTRGDKAVLQLGREHEDYRPRGSC